jgi:hypothetical protein
MHGEVMDRIRENLCEFLEEYGMERLDPRNIEPVYMAMVAYEKSLKAEVLEEELDGGYSREGGMSNDGYSERRGYSREGGNSGRRGYSREGGSSYDEGGDSYRRDSRGRYSRDDGKKHLKEQVEMMMRQAGTTQEKDMARKFMDLLEK